MPRIPVSCSLLASSWPRRSSGAQDPFIVGEGGGVGSILKEVCVYVCVCEERRIVKEERYNGF